MNLYLVHNPDGWGRTRGFVVRARDEAEARGLCRHFAHDKLWLTDAVDVSVIPVDGPAEVILCDADQ